MINFTAKIKELPITKARKNLTQILDHLEVEEMVILVKNYQPRAILVNPNWFDQFPSLLQLRKQIWGKHTQEISEALDCLAGKTKEQLPKLLRL